MDTWTDTAYSFPDVTGRKILIVGLGGGCDIISAYALARMLPPGARTVVYANTKKFDDGRTRPITDHVRRVPSKVREVSGPTNGTTRLEGSVPRGDMGCPWILLMNNEDAEQALLADIPRLGFDLVFAVDTGGDSLVGGASSGEEGRDKRMLRILQRLELPLIHVVLAPGCDGESTSGQLHGALAAEQALKRFQGCFSLEPIFEIFRTLSAPLTPRRTPRIILAAAEGRLPRAGGDLVFVPRGRKPAVPRDWLTRGFVFADAPALVRAAPVRSGRAPAVPGR